MNRRLLSATIFTAWLIAPAASLGAQPSPHDSLLVEYRRGSMKEAVSKLIDWSASAPSANAILRCVENTRSRTRDDLEADLLFHSEVLFSGWGDDVVGPTVMPHAVMRAHLRVVRRLHELLKQKDSRSEFLRRWYLVWESFRQGNDSPFFSLETDYLEPALAAFPQDAGLLLAAGSRDEMIWWGSADNPQRRPKSQAGVAEQFLRSARGWFRKSVSADPNLDESRLRLARVLLALNDLDGADEQLRRLEKPSTDHGFTYLVRLFAGELYERRGDRVTAAAVYREAIGLVPVAQAARMAAAHVAYVGGQRDVAADDAARALNDRSTGSDPWWWYVRGQLWRFEAYRREARAMVHP